MKDMGKEKPATDVERQRVYTMIKFQFPSVKLPDIEDLKVVHSRKTGRISQIISGKRILFHLRPMDGRYLPTLEGAEFLLSNGLKTNIVVATEEAVPFVSIGKSLFNKHVKKVTGNIFPNSEVMITDEKGKLIAVGTSQQPGYAMMELNNGVAVKTKHYYKTSPKTH